MCRGWNQNNLENEIPDSENPNFDIINVNQGKFFNFTFQLAVNLWVYKVFHKLVSPLTFLLNGSSRGQNGFPRNKIYKI